MKFYMPSPKAGNLSTTYLKVGHFPHFEHISVIGRSLLLDIAFSTLKFLLTTKVLNVIQNLLP